MLSMKFFDNHVNPSTAEMVEFATKHPEIGLEISDYKETHFVSIAKKLQALAPEQKSMHLNHNVYTLMDLAKGKDDESWRAFVDEMEMASRLEIAAGAVMHIFRTEAVEHRYHPKAGKVLPWRSRPDVRMVSETLLRAAEISVSRGHLFVENVYEQIPFFEELFEVFEQRGGADGSIGFCLDVGHCRVFSDHDMENWLKFVEEIAAAGYSIHAHIHCNGGVEDDHIPLIEADGLGLLGPLEGFSAGFLADVVRALEVVGDEHFVFETAMPLCIENVRWFRNEVLSLPLAASNSPVGSRCQPVEASASAGL